MEKFVPILGGMHTLMSFTRCVGLLMANSGLTQLLKPAFEDVQKCSLARNFHKISGRFVWLPKNHYVTFSKKISATIMISFLLWKMLGRPVALPSLG